MKFKGIGKSIAACIDEILQTGTTERLKHPEERDKAIEMISKIVGFNYSKAREVVDKYHVRTIDDLKKIELTNKQKIGLKYLKDFEQKIPRSEVKKFEKFIKEAASEVDDKITVDMCGEFRRGYNECDKIIVLLSHPEITQKSRHHALLSEVVEILKEKNILTDDIHLGEERYLGVCKLPEKNSTHRQIESRILS